MKLGTWRSALPPRRSSHIDLWKNLVQVGAEGRVVAKISSQRRFTVSVGQSDFDALTSSAEVHLPPLTLKYVVNVAVKTLLERHAARQFAFPLDE